ncbi:MAG TPA: sigma-70 family RNA polymerase sigma factor [Solirubrobacterales bacterium]|jgi:RNA polymerase sigma factor (sigma-70 family)|nr:sigma-70 family RNA polymerase sigma factor [Solirubrobacterales bacterium]
MDRQRSLARAYRRHHQAIYRYCLAIVGNPDDAQEALQNTMVKALRALQGEQREIQLKPWLYRIAHNESIELLRKRRETSEIDAELAASGEGLAETAAQRERLRHLLADLRELPERQRAALVMRELSGLGFEEIGEAFDTSKAVARQTVYEARLGLRELEAGREMDCGEVMHRLSNADGRVSRRRDIRAHLRDCPDCRAFRDAIGERREDLAALSPLPVAASAAILHAALGGSQASAAAGAGAAGAGTAATAGAGKAVATSIVLKSAATVAAVAAIGTGVADRTGLIDLGIPGDGSRAKPVQASGENAAVKRMRARASERIGGSGSSATKAEPGSAGKGRHAGTKEAGPSSHAASPSSGQLPAASKHGQETAASHGGGREAGRSHAQGGSSGAGAPQEKTPPPSNPVPNPAKPEQPSSSQPPVQGNGPDNSTIPPSQAPEGSPGQGGHL